MIKIEYNDLSFNAFQATNPAEVTLSRGIDSVKCADPSATSALCTAQYVIKPRNVKVQRSGLCSIFALEIPSVNACCSVVFIRQKSAAGMCCELVFWFFQFVYTVYSMNIFLSYLAWSSSFVSFVLVINNVKNREIEQNIHAYFEIFELKTKDQSLNLFTVMLYKISLIITTRHKSITSVAKTTDKRL